MKPAFYSDNVQAPLSSKKLQDYTGDSGQKISIDLDSPELRSIINRSVKRIEAVTGLTPGKANANDPGVRKEIYEAWINHVSPLFEDQNIAAYGKKRQEMYKNGGDAASLNQFIQTRTAVCRELSVTASIVFAEYGIRTSVVSGGLNIYEGISKHAWVIDDLGMVIDSNALRGVAPNEQAYASVMNNMGVNKKTQVVQPRTFLR